MSVKVTGTGGSVKFTGMGGKMKAFASGGVVPPPPPIGDGILSSLSITGGEWYDAGTMSWYPKTGTTSLDPSAPSSTMSYGWQASNDLGGVFTSTAANSYFSSPRPGGYQSTVFIVGSRAFLGGAGGTIPFVVTATPVDPEASITIDYNSEQEEGTNLSTIVGIAEDVTPGPWGGSLTVSPQYDGWRVYVDFTVTGGTGTQSYSMFIVALAA